MEQHISTNQNQKLHAWVFFLSARVSKFVLEELVIEWVLLLTTIENISNITGDKNSWKSQANLLTNTSLHTHCAHYWKHFWAGWKMPIFPFFSSWIGHSIKKICYQQNAVSCFLEIIWDEANCILTKLK